MIVLNLQFWGGDADRAMGLARLIADLEPVKREDVLFMFTARFDCPHDEEAIKYVEEKFNVIRYTTKRKATGWPNGPNQMMGCSYEHLVLLDRVNKLNGMKAVLFIEADCVPLKADWIDLLISEYKECGKPVLGAWMVKGDTNVDHINGNCIVSLDFWRKNRHFFHPPSKGGWDAVFAPSMMQNGAPSRLIWSDYQLCMDHNPWRGDDFLWEGKSYRAAHNPLYGETLYPCWFHGIKTEQGLVAVRKKLLP
jgi:hypothetical protein